MKVLIYNNKEKDYLDKILNCLINELTLCGIEYQILSDSDLNKSFNARALFAIGGDGTILYLAEFYHQLQMLFLNQNLKKESP